MSMFRCLSPGAVGIKGLQLGELPSLAQAADFEGIDIPAGEVMEAVTATSADAVTERFNEAGLRPGGGPWVTGGATRGTGRS